MASNEEWTHADSISREFETYNWLSVQTSLFPLPHLWPLLLTWINFNPGMDK